MTLRTSLVHCAATLSCLSLLAACGGSNDPAPAPPPAAVAPTITTPPAAVAVTEGQSASFTVAASGTAPLAYQWRRGGSTIAGATAATYTLAAATLADNAAAFSVLVSNSAGSATSGAAVLTVNPLAVIPTITAQPAPATLAVGGTATFTVAASGTPMPSVQWLIVGGADLADGAGSGALAGATIAGAATPTLTLTNVPQSANGLQLAARATNSAGAATSSGAALTVNSAGTAISAAAGGTATSPDGKARAIFPPDAFTADTVVTFTPVPAAALPDNEDFASFQPVAGGYYRIDFAGGLLRHDVEVEYGFLPQAPVTVQRVRPQSTPPASRPMVGVIRCSNGRSELYFGRSSAGYDAIRAILCAGEPSNSVTVGPAVLIPPPAASLLARTLPRTGDDWLLNVISFSNGRSAFGFRGLVPPGNLVYGLGIVAANGSISSGIVGATSDDFAVLVGFDGNGQVLALLAGCRLAAYGQRVSSLLGSFISTTPTWTVQLTVGPPPFNSCLGQITAAAPAPGGGWVVANGFNLDRYSSTGVVTPLLRPASFPVTDIRRHISYRRLAVDSVTGNIWGVGALNSSNFFDCGFSNFGPCPALVKLDSNGTLLSQTILGTALTESAITRAPMALALDSAGNAYAAQRSTEFIPGGSTSGVGGIVVKRIAATTGVVSWSVRLSNSQSQELGEIAINGSGQVFVSRAPDGIVHRLDATTGAETGVVTAGAPFARSVVNGLSVNPAGTLTYIGDLRGTLDGVTSATCIPPDTRSCTDIFVRRFNF